jgi:hypothetical protein
VRFRTALAQRKAFAHHGLKTYEGVMVYSDQSLRVWEAKLAGHYSAFNTHMTMVANFASLAINSIILANGAAAGGILAMLGAMWGDEAITKVLPPALRSLEIFAYGAFGAIVAASFSYCAQYFYAHANFNSINEKYDRHNLLNRIAIVFHVVALLAAVAGVASFIVGSLWGIEALQGAKGGVPSESAATAT